MTGEGAQAAEWRRGRKGKTGFGTGIHGDWRRLALDGFKKEEEEPACSGFAIAKTKKADNMFAVRFSRSMSVDYL
ncbi:MAG TPA: hypothetical protein VEC06_15205 [Paucimonas sp.]|nr:hypothetical protein [Paucimonas sp.]